MCHKNLIRGTTIVAVRRNGEVAICGDGQVSLGQSIMKHRATKIRKICDGKVLAGFSGAVADSLTLFERFEEKLNEHRGNMMRAAVKFARDWRMDRYLRRLEAILLVADKEHILIISGNGEVIEAEEDIASVGSGGSYALAAGKALLKHTSLSAVDIAKESLLIASKICVYTNDQITVETL